MNSSALCVIVLLVGVSHLDWALGPYPLRGGAEAFEPLEKRGFGVPAVLVDVAWKYNCVGHPPGLLFGLVLSVCTSGTHMFI